MFSVIIPTMWKYTPFLQFLEDLNRFELIDEILVFDNDPDHKPNTHSLNDSKVSFTRDSCHLNIGVNPAWNWGVAKARNEKIAILNDDFIFDLRVFLKADKLLNAPTTGVIGMAPGDHPTITHQPALTTGTIDIIPQTPDIHRWGFGYAMFMNKRHWDNIPEDMKIFCGDDWIFDGCKMKKLTNYIITNFLWRTPGSVTSGAMEAEFGDHDKLLYTGYHLARLIKHA